MKIFTEGGKIVGNSDGNDTGAKLNIFFSFKVENQEIVESIRKELLNYCSGVNIFLSANITPGENWQQWIRKSLRKSSLLFLFYIEPSSTWDWCLFETGLFKGMELDTHNRVICLHHESITPPEPLKLFQTVHTDKRSLTDFIDRFYTKTDITGLPEPLNPNLASDKIKQIAEFIHTLIVPTQKEVRKKFYNNYLNLSINNSNDMSLDRLASAVIDSNESTLEMFGLEHFPPSGGKWTWGDIRKIIVEGDSVDWFSKLESALISVCKGRKFTPIQATLRSFRDEKIYRPVLDKKTLFADGTVRFYISFIEQFSEGFATRYSEFGPLLASLNMGSRFRDEVILRFLGKIIYVKNNPKELDLFCRKLKGSILNIVKESEVYGFLSQEKIVKEFDTTDEKKEITEMYLKWNNIFQQITDAIEKKDIEQIEKQLCSMKNINIKFLSRAAMQYHDNLNEIVRPYSSHRNH